MPAQASVDQAGKASAAPSSVTAAATPAGASTAVAPPASTGGLALAPNVEMAAGSPLAPMTIVLPCMLKLAGSALALARSGVYGSGTLSSSAPRRLSSQCRRGKASWPSASGGAAVTVSASASASVALDALAPESATRMVTAWAPAGAPRSTATPSHSGCSPATSGAASV